MFIRSGAFGILLLFSLCIYFLHSSSFSSAVVYCTVQLGASDTLLICLLCHEYLSSFLPYPTTIVDITLRKLAEIIIARRSDDWHNKVRTNIN